MVGLQLSPTSIQSPCKDCRNRNLSCHNNCSSYLDFRKNLDNYNTKKLEGFHSTTIEYFQDMKTKTFRRQRQQKR